MNKYHHAIPLLILVCLLMSCGQHDLDSVIQQGAKRLIGNQVNELLTGSSIRLEGQGQTATVEFRQDGTMAGTNTTGEKDKGEWKVKGNELCLNFKKWGQGDILCYRVVQNGGDYTIYNRKGMMCYAFSVLTPGEQKGPTDIHSTSPPKGTADHPAAVNLGVSPDHREKILPTSPQVAADVDFILRQSAQNCPGCNLAHAQLAGQTLIGANLQGANLTEANLSHANLRRANLRGANLYRANLRQADLAGADLTGANLSEALRD